MRYVCALQSCLQSLLIPCSLIFSCLQTYAHAFFDMVYRSSHPGVEMCQILNGTHWDVSRFSTFSFSRTPLAIVGLMPKIAQKAARPSTTSPRSHAGLRFQRPETADKCVGTGGCLCDVGCPAGHKCIGNRKLNSTAHG